MRSLRLISTLALVAAAPAGAQQFLPQSTLISVVQTHKASLLRYIDAAPDSMLGFRPTPGVRNFAEQIQHAAFADALIAHLAITGSMAVPSMGDSAVYLHNKAELRAYAIRAMDHTVEMLRGVKDADMLTEVSMFGNKVPRFRGLMELLDHFPWTLGQTVPYLRMNGVTPPTYTPF
jgi:DinB family protein